MPSTAADGFSHPYIASVCYGSAFYAFAALVLSVLAILASVLHTFVLLHRTLS